jgi:hypothetical protein
MMAEYKEKEALKVVTDEEPLTPPAPVVTVTGDAGQSFSYPERTFTPEEPKAEATVTLKTSGEIHDGSGRLADKAVLAGMGLALTVSMALMVSRKFGLRSPIAAPECNIALTSRMDDSAMLARADLEDPEPIAPDGWASSAVERALAAADAKA